MSDNPNELETSARDIPCMLLPLIDEFLLLPTVTVAEMAPIQPFEIIPNTPDWFLGFYTWRNVRVPVVSFETINNDASPKLTARGRVAVLNSTGLSDKIPFLGLLTQNIPRMARVEENDIEENVAVKLRPHDLMAVTVGLEEFMMPSLESIEAAVLALNLK